MAEKKKFKLYCGVVELPVYALILWSIIALLLQTYGGVLFGLASAVIGILSFYVFPQLYEVQIQKAIAQGAPEAMTRKMVEFAMYFSILYVPIIYAGIGALVSWISSLIAKKA